MPNYSQKDRIILAIEAIRSSHKKLNQRHAAAMYNIPQQTLNNQMKGVPRHKKTHIKQQKLDPLEEQMLLQYTLD